MRSRAVALLGALLLVLSPAAALAQSAGDEQYTDPFADQSPTRDDSSTPDSPEADSSPTPDSNDQVAQTSPSGTGSGNGSGAGESGSGSSLPRTGLPAGILALAGGVMLLGGAALRRGAAPVRARGTAPATLGRDVLLTRRLR